MSALPKLEAIIGKHGRTFGRFAAVGGVGFISDFALLLYFVHVMGLSPFLGRALSLAIAILVTWAFNKHWSFQQLGSVSRTNTLIPYYAIQGLGALINYATYSLILLIFPPLEAYLLIPMAVGSGVALISNYLLGRWLFASG